MAQRSLGFHLHKQCSQSGRNGFPQPRIHNIAEVLPSGALAEPLLPHRLETKKCPSVFFAMLLWIDFC